MAVINVKIKGVNELIKNFDRFGKEGENKVKAITKFQAQEISQNAKLNAQSQNIWDNGDLVRGIHPQQEDTKGFSWLVVAEQPYSAYHEFGTGRKVSIPSGWGELAAQFRGKGIKEVNIMPRPFLRPAFLKGSKFYVKDLKEQLVKLTKKYS